MTAPRPNDDYLSFLEAKVRLAEASGYRVETADLHPALKGHQGVMVQWGAAGGRRAWFAKFGLGKSVVQLEAARQWVLGQRAAANDDDDGPLSPEPLALIVCPLGVRAEFVRDARELLGMRAKFIRSVLEAWGADVYLTNYETVRDGKLDPKHFGWASLDEASCLRGMGGSKTFREFMRLFEPVPFRFVATATPSPNEYIELLAYAAFLGVMDVGEAKTRFFKRDSEHADALTIHPHKEEEFWLWVASWGLFVERPSDLGFSDDGYDLPPLKVIEHAVTVDHSLATPDKSGQGNLFREARSGIVDAAREKRATLWARAARTVEIVADAPGDHFLLWHDLEAEREAIEALLPGVRTVYGTQDLEEREDLIAGFSAGAFPWLATKPVLAGSGCNFQRFCRKAVFMGLGFKFNDFIQAVHRIQRFLQTGEVEIHLVYAASERAVRDALMAKWARHDEQSARMREIIVTYGLNNAAMADALTRSLGTERIEASGPGYRCINNDCVLELRTWPENCVDLIVTSIPFSTQYEYTPSYNDFGHTDSNAHFFEQMGFLVPELMRVLKPGRVACIHVKDRIVPGGLTGLGFQTLYPFADDVRTAFRAAGFAYIGKKTNLTDVVRENNQTYRLGWTEQCKDGSRMGTGIPEEVLLFRKPPSDNSNGYADKPVVKSKSDYTRARWQTDAHHLSRSAGDRFLATEEWLGFEADVIYRTWRQFNLDRVYDFEHHVRIGEALDVVGKLPPTFALLPVHSWHEDVWTNVAQMLSLNTLQSGKGAEKHLCPLPFDIVDRLINQFSMKGEIVLDPFGGLMTVPYQALKHGRAGIGIELNPRYFLDGATYCKARASEMGVATLFDFIGERVAAEEAA